MRIFGVLATKTAMGDRPGSRVVRMLCEYCVFKPAQRTWDNGRTMYGRRTWSRSSDSL
ncbi:hypothetical protein BJV78DRAFT_1242332 [Lactifluus subvellereus]|nr:hypothetical protein BJV78DRAFT_1242332 [Lactifluus subvellereus]